MPSKSPQKNNWQKAAHLSGAGLQMGLTIYFGFLIGKWLDKEFEKKFFTETLTLVAIFLSIFTLIKQVNKLND